MIMVSPEIEATGIAAAQADEGIARILGVKPESFHPLHSIYSAVERPAGESSLPIGGAITWGGEIVAAAEHYSGFVIADGVMKAAWMDPGSDHSAAHVVQVASERAGAEVPFDPDLWKSSPEEAINRLKTLSASAGALSDEIIAAKEHVRDLRAAITKKEAELIRAESRPMKVATAPSVSVTPEEAYVRSKLTQRHQLTHPVADTAQELMRLAALKEKIKAVNVTPPKLEGSRAHLSDLKAQYKALAEKMSAGVTGGGDGPDSGPMPSLDPAVRARIEKLVDSIETQRNEITAEMLQRDVTQNLLRVANKARNIAVDERRNGQGMLKLHTDLARLDTVMAMALALNEINASQAKIGEMMDFLESRRGSIAAAKQKNEGNLEKASADQTQVAQWRADAQKTVDDDLTSQQDLTELEAQAKMAAGNTESFQTRINGLLSQINATDRAGSADALAEYERRLALLPQIAKWRTSGGNPNDPTAFTLKEFQDDLVQVNDYIQKAQEGISKIPTVPIEFAGILVVTVPGPEVSVKNPTREQVLKILSDRKVYWRDQAATYQKNLDRVLDLLNH
jgi:HAMP domain-containing protein